MEISAMERDKAPAMAWESNPMFPNNMQHIVQGRHQGPETILKLKYLKEHDPRSGRAGERTNTPAAVPASLVKELFSTATLMTKAIKNQSH